MSGSNGSSAPPPPPPARQVLGASQSSAPPSSSELPAPVRRFLADGREWIARVSGQCAYGTGRQGAAALLSLDFAAADDPERSVRRGLLPRGRFFTLFDDELRQLFEQARPVLGETSD